ASPDCTPSSWGWRGSEAKSCGYVIGAGQGRSPLFRVCVANKGLVHRIAAAARILEHVDMALGGPISEGGVRAEIRWGWEAITATGIRKEHQALQHRYTILLL